MSDIKEMLSIVLDIKYSKFIKKKAKFCNYNGCQKEASYNYENNKSKLYCNSHKLIKLCFEYTEDKGLPKAIMKTLTHRLNKLKEEIEKNIKLIPNEHITIIKLFYDGI